jgi:hypothetical protein
MNKGHRIDAQCQAAGSQGHIARRLIDGLDINNRIDVMFGA